MGKVSVGGGYRKMNEISNIDNTLYAFSELFPPQEQETKFDFQAVSVRIDQSHTEFRLYCLSIFAYHIYVSFVSHQFLFEFIGIAVVVIIIIFLIVIGSRSKESEGGNYGLDDILLYFLLNLIRPIVDLNHSIVTCLI